MVLITTPTGHIGSRALARLVAAGRPVRVIARDPGKLPAAVRPRVEVVAGSSDDPAVLTAACRGASALLWVCPPNGRADSVMGWYCRFAAAAATAVQEARVPRVVHVSSGGWGVTDAGPVSGLHAAEAVLDQSGAATRHLRCGFFMENFLHQARAAAETGVLAYPFPADLPVPMVAARDIGDVAARWLADDTWAGAGAAAVHGPADRTLAEAAGVLGGVLGREVRAVEVTDDQAREGVRRLGVSPHYADQYVRMCRAFRAGGYRREPRTQGSTTPTTLEQWAAETLASHARPA